MTKVKIFSCNEENHKKILPDLLKKLNKKCGTKFSMKNVEIEIMQANGTTLRSQREQTPRIIIIEENGKIVYMIGCSNTNYDEDKKKEFETKGEKYLKYGEHNYHSNTYFNQGRNKIFEHFFNEKEKNENVSFFFYLLDVNKSYASNLSNLLT